MIRPSLLRERWQHRSAGDVRAMRRTMTPGTAAGARCFWRRAAAVGTGIAPAAALTLPRELFPKIRAIRAANIRRG